MNQPTNRIGACVMSMRLQAAYRAAVINAYDDFLALQEMRVRAGLNEMEESIWNQTYQVDDRAEWELTEVRK